MNKKIYSKEKNPKSKGKGRLPIISAVESALKNGPGTSKLRETRPEEHNNQEHYK